MVHLAIQTTGINGPNVVWQGSAGVAVPQLNQPRTGIKLHILAHCLYTGSEHHHIEGHETRGHPVYHIDNDGCTGVYEWSRAHRVAGLEDCWGNSPIIVGPASSIYRQVILSRTHPS